MVNKLVKTLLALMLAGTVACSAAAISVSAAANSTAQTSAAALSSYDSILKDIEALPAPQKKAADVDYNNAITVTDVTLIQKYISGSISQFNGLSAYSMNVESCKSVKTVKLIDPVEKSKVSVSTACPNSDINWLSAKTVADANGMVSEIEVTAYINNSGKARTGTVYVKIERSAGFLFFAMVFIAAFGIPILAYYITNAACRLRVVKKHKYIAYHAVVKSVRSYKISINDNGRHYSYKYATCVGIREKNVHDTKAVLIFIPDDVLVFPDK